MGLALRMAREDRGLSIRGLARLARLRDTTILRIERGQHAPLPATAKRLAQVLEEIQGEELVLQRTRIQRGSREHLRDVVSWDRDEVAQYAVEHHPEGLTQRQVGAVLGLDQATVLRVEAIALAKLREDAAEGSPRGEAVRGWVEALQARQARAERPSSASDWRAMDPPPPTRQGSFPGGGSCG